MASGRSSQRLASYLTGRPTMHVDEDAEDWQHEHQSSPTRLTPS